MTFVDYLFGRKKQSDLTAELESRRLRNEARFKAMREKMQDEGKHLLNPKFKWVSADEFAMKNGL